MNYDFKIRELELRLNHCKELQDHLSGGIDVHDETLGIHSERMDRLQNALETLTADVDKLALSVDKLVNALRKDLLNGHQEPHK